MKPWEIWLSHISTLLVAVSGLAYLWMKYMMATEDPFSLVNHPWQPAMLSLHLVAAPFLVFTIGLMVQSHIQKKLRSGKRSNRGSGLVSMSVLPVMIASGYMLQVVVSPALATVALVLHLVSSSIFLLTYVAHLIISIRLLNKPATEGARNAFVRRQPA